MVSDPPLAANHVKTRLPDRLDLRQHVTGKVIDPLFGHLLVVEDHQLPDGAVTALQLLAHPDDRLGDGRRPRDRLEDQPLPSLDPLGELDLALACQQRHRPHLAQIHPGRVVGLVDRARRQIQLDVVHSFATPVVLLVRPVRLFRADDLDAGVAEGGEQLRQRVGRGDVGREQLVHLVIEQVPLLLAELDELPDFVVCFFERQRCSSALVRGCGQTYALQTVEPVTYRCGTRRVCQARSSGSERYTRARPHAVAPMNCVPEDKSPTIDLYRKNAFSHARLLMVTRRLLPPSPSERLHPPDRPIAGT